MSDIVLSGQITAVLPLQQGVSQRTGQPWQSQSYLLCYEPGQYPKNVCFSVFGDKIQQFAIQQGEQLSVHLNIEAKQGQKGYFNDVQAWKVERPGQQMVQQPMQGYQQMPPQQSPFPPQQPMVQGQPVQSPFPPQQAQPQQPAPGQAPFPPQQQVPPQNNGLPFQ